MTWTQVRGAISAAAAAALIAGLGAGLAPDAASATAAAAARIAGRHARAGSVTDGKFVLNDVSVLSSTDAWAVGNSATVLHWNGASWAPVAIPGQSGFVDRLYAVDALSPSDVWAAGQQVAVPSQVTTTLIAHWNGTAWKQVPGPGPSNSNLIPDLAYLSMGSATDGWATGEVHNRSTGANTDLVQHWNGTSWRQVTTSPAFLLGAVHAVSPSDATAVGSDHIGSHTFTPAAFHWNGTGWSLTATLPPPHGASASQLGGPYGLSADSATDMWTVGDRQTSTGPKNLAWHRNGTRWAVMAVPSPGLGGGLLGVAATSPAAVWAVGYTGTTNGTQATVSVHWNGTSWARVATPNPGGSNQDAVLNGVAAGPGSIWAVGYYYTGQLVPNTLILRWNGTRWIRS